MMIPYGIAAILLFTVPPATPIVKGIYVFITYNFCTTVVYTALNLPYATLATLMTRDTDQRAVVNLFRTGMSALGNMVITAITFPLVTRLGDTQQAMDRGFHSLRHRLDHHAVHLLQELPRARQGRNQNQGRQERSALDGHQAVRDEQVFLNVLHALPCSSPSMKPSPAPATLITRSTSSATATCSAHSRPSNPFRDRHRSCPLPVHRQVWQAQ